VTACGEGNRWARLGSGAVVCAVLLCLMAAACRREQRNYREAPPAVTTNDVTLSELHPGGGAPSPPVHTPYENNAVAVSDGKRLFSAYNCVGCHGHGGGGSGPALRDDQWIYGHEADQIYHTILEGRPNGMPSFRGKIPDYQIWQLAAYIRSMGGMVPKDVAPSRDDHMSGAPPESSTIRQQPRNSSQPPSTVQ
jgi:cytochrome c oxidase cbb3-type subunit III